MFLKIISILGSLTFLSRILGYLRDLLIAKISVLNEPYENIKQTLLNDFEKIK